MEEIPTFRNGTKDKLEKVYLQATNTTFPVFNSSWRPTLSYTP